MDQKQHTIDDKDKQINRRLQASEKVTAEFQRNLLQHKQTIKQLQETIGKLRWYLQQLAEEKQAGERQLWELNQQLQTTKQEGAQIVTPQLATQPRDTITQPRWELQQARQLKEKQHVSEGRVRQLRKPMQQLQIIKQTTTQPGKVLVQQKTIQDMKWQKESKAPEKMSRESAISDSNMAYVNINRKLTHRGL